MNRKAFVGNYFFFIMGILFLTVIYIGYVEFEADFKNGSVKNYSYFVENKTLRWKGEHTANATDDMMSYMRNITVNKFSDRVYQRMGIIFYKTANWFGEISMEVADLCFQFGYFHGYKFNSKGWYNLAWALIWLFIAIKLAPVFFVVGVLVYLGAVWVRKKGGGG